MAELDKDIDKMMEEIKKPQHGKKWIYERAGEKVYRREFGAEHDTRVKIKPEEVKDD